MKCPVCGSESIECYGIIESFVQNDILYLETEFSCKDCDCSFVEQTKQYALPVFDRQTIIL